MQRGFPGLFQGSIQAHIKDSVEMKQAHMRDMFMSITHYILLYYKHTYNSQHMHTATHSSADIYGSRHTPPRAPNHTHVASLSIHIAPYPSYHTQPPNTNTAPCHTISPHIYKHIAAGRHTFQRQVCRYAHCPLMFSYPNSQAPLTSLSLLPLSAHTL